MGEGVLPIMLSIITWQFPGNKVSKMDSKLMLSNFKVYCEKNFLGCRAIWQATKKLHAIGRGQLNVLISLFS